MDLHGADRDNRAGFHGSESGKPREPERRGCVGFRGGAFDRTDTEIVNHAGRGEAAACLKLRRV